MTYFINIAVCIVYILVLGYFIKKNPFFKIKELTIKNIQLIFLLKVVFGFLLYFVYTYYYPDRSTADIFKYFDDSKVMFDAIFTNPSDYFRMLFGIGNNTPHFDQYYVKMYHWSREYDGNLYNDSHAIIRFNALMRLFSFGFYPVHSIVMCFLSLTGLVAIFKTFVGSMGSFPTKSGLTMTENEGRFDFAQHDKEKSILLTFAVFLVPSVLFWGSGVLKEGV